MGRRPSGRRGGAGQGQDFTESVGEHERRLARDRLLGTAGMIIFGVVVVANLVMEFMPDLVLLPGGHSELYLVLGLIGLGWALWVRFDLGVNRQQRR